MKSLEERIDGQLRQLRSMRQYADKLESGEMSEDDLQRLAIARLSREDDPTPTPTVDHTDYAAADAAYRAEQRRLYIEQYDWSEGTNANDLAGLEGLLDIEVAQLRLRRDLDRASIPWRERTELLDAMRQLTRSHSEQQRSLQIDRPARVAREEAPDFLTVYREQIQDGAAYVRQLMSEAATYSEEARSIEEMRAYMRHSGGMPYPWIDAFLFAYDRLGGRPPNAELQRIHDEEQKAA